MNRGRVGFGDAPHPFAEIKHVLGVPAILWATHGLLSEARLPLDLFLDDVEATRCHRVSGTAVVMTSAREGVPSVLMHHFKHNKVLHERVVLMSFVSVVRPEVRDDERLAGCALFCRR